LWLKTEKKDDYEPQNIEKDWPRVEKVEIELHEDEL